MGNIFSASEVLEFSIQIEKNGREFYNTLSQKSKNTSAVSIFKHLAEEEERHKETFEGLLNELIKYEPPESYPGEYIAYMQALASENIFTRKHKGEDIAKNTKGDKEAIDLGIGFEKDSIVFYEGMKASVPREEHNIINKIIAQEQSHLQKLSDLKKTL